MEVITSKTNSKIVEAKKLLDKKYRDKTGLFLIETKKVIFEAINAGLVPQKFFVLEGSQNIFVANKNISSKNSLYNSNINSNNNANNVFVLSKSVFGEISSVVSSDGYIAVFEKPENQKRYDDGNFLVLDNIQNPDNMGAIMRTALATNFKQIFVIDCVDEFSPKVIRASMGNQFKLQITHIAYDDISKLFKNANLFTASMEGKSVFDIKSFSKNVGLVIGNEGRGVSQTLKNLVPNTISIPMKNGVESLNASVSASILMYYISQNQKWNI